MFSDKIEYGNFHVAYLCSSAASIEEYLNLYEICSVGYPASQVCLKTEICFDCRKGSVIVQIFFISCAYSFLISLNMAIFMRLTSALVPHPLKGI